MNQIAILMWTFFLYESKIWVMLASHSKGISKCLERIQHQRILKILYREDIGDKGSFKK